MKIKIIAFGKLKESSAESRLIQDYSKRFKFNFDIKEIEVKKAASIEEIKKLESELILAYIEPKTKVILFDRNGINITSEGFASKLQHYPNITFIIGGSNGFSADLLNKPYDKISFGLTTWPHMLFRVMVVEQIYRGWCINNNHPYHK